MRKKGREERERDERGKGGRKRDKGRARPGGREGESKYTYLHFA